MKNFRPILIVAMAAVIFAAGAERLLAADDYGAAYLLRGDWRRPGNYLSWFKLLVFWLTFLAWVRAADWVNRDAQDVNLDWRRWNPIVFGSFLTVVVLCWLIPWFWLNLFLMLGALVGPVTAYILYRNSQVPSNVRVLTPEHLRWWLATRLKKVGIKMSTERFDPNAGGVPVTVFGRGAADPQADAVRVLGARQCAGLPAARQILAQGLSARASAILLDFGQAVVAVRYMIDGLWTPQESLEREVADPALEALKVLCGLNPQERRGRQEGKFGVDYYVIRQDVLAKVDKAEEAFRKKLTIDLTKKLASEEMPPAQLQQEVATSVEEQAREKFATPVGGWTPVDRERLPKLPGIDALNPVTSLERVKCPVTLAAQGTQGGERVVIQFEVKATAHMATLEDLGMRAKVLEQLKEVTGRPKGFVLFSAPPSGGLRTTMKAVLHDMDRFTREIMSVEDEANRYDEVENVAVRIYKATPGETAVETLTKVFREEPHVLAVRDLVNAEVVSLLCRDIAESDRVILGSIRARDCAEAMLRVLAMGVAPAEFGAALTGVMCQRLVRKLCDKCKEPFAPPPQVLQQLGIPEGRIRAFYRPPQPKPGEQDQKDLCRECGGAGYKGQTAIFEILAVDDTVRKTLATTPKLDPVRQAARKAGMKSLQEEGILLLARGVTSLPELMRVLKG